MRYVRSALLVGLVVSALVGLALPAGAHVTDFSWLSAEGDCPDGNPPCDQVEWDTAAGTITCTAGETFVASVRIIQKEGAGVPGYRAFGKTDGVCTGSSQEWRLQFTDETGYIVCGVPYELLGRARTFVNGVAHGDQATDRWIPTWPC